MPDLDPILHQPARLRIMAALHRNRQLSFPAMRHGLGLTPGNLGSHLERLETAGYLESARVLVGISFEMRYRITPRGNDAFERYAAALRDLLADVRPDRHEGEAQTGTLSRDARPSE